MLITLSALIGRINRALAHEDERVRHSRYSDKPNSQFQQLGEYWIHNWRFNYPSAVNIDPESLGRELGVLRDWESVRPD